MSGVFHLSTRRPVRRGSSPSRRPGPSARSRRTASLSTAPLRGEAPFPANLSDGVDEVRAALNATPPLRWTPWLALALAAGAGAVLVRAPGAQVALATALGVGAILVGWFLGEGRRGALADEVEGREGELRRALTELELAQTETVRRLSMAVEFRDEDTGAHIERIGRFSTLLAEQVGMEREFCERMLHAAPLHDVGKVAIPDAILLKPGALTPEERAIIETHAEEGHRLLKGSSSAILEMAATIALSHQEKWDGSGYPRGLAGESIPIEGRIVAIADVFDALTSDRVYRRAYSVGEAVKIMREGRGSHFDPVLLDAFMEVLERSGPEARAAVASDPELVAERALEAYATALERGDAEMAEGAVMTAIEDGIQAATLHGEVIAPALRRLEELLHAGELDRERHTLALGISRRVLATLARYMLAGAEQTHGRVLVAGVEGDEHPLELQMMHDQLAAAGYRTILAPQLAVCDLRAAVESHRPDVLLVGSCAPEDVEQLELALSDLLSAHPELPVVLGGAAAGGALPDEHEGMRALERIDESVEAVQALLADRTSVASR